MKQNKLGVNARLAYSHGSEIVATGYRWLEPYHGLALDQHDTSILAHGAGSGAGNGAWPARS